MKNEFDQLSEENDLQILKDIVPTWVNERLEPFISPIEDSVVPPTYNEIGNLVGDGGSNTQSNDQAGEIIEYIVGVKVGDVYVAKNVTASVDNVEDV